MGPTPADDVVELDTTIAATPMQVWQALTTPALCERWMSYRMTSSWQVGAPFAIVGPLAGTDYAETGTIVGCEPPTLLRYEHWSALWRVPDAPGNRAVMTLRIAPHGDATRVSLRHELPAVEAIGPHSRFFWTVALGRLRRLLEQGEA